jgi:hypothetical protein
VQGREPEVAAAVASEDSAGAVAACAAGAKPTMRIDGAGSPQPTIGVPVLLVPKGPTADRGYLLAPSDEARAYPADLLPRGQLGQGYSALGETTGLGRIGGDRGVGQAVISV